MSLTVAYNPQQMGRDGTAPEYSLGAYLWVTMA